MLMVEKKQRGRKAIFYGWWIVAAFAALVGWGGGVNFYGFAVFFVPISSEFGWSRAQTSLIFSLARLEAGIEGPPLGYLIDRFGARIFIVIGVIMFGVGYMLLSWVDSFLTFALVYVLVMSLGYVTASSHSVYATVAKWFIRRRSTVIGVLSAGVGIGGAVFLPLLGWALTQYDWRSVAFVAGILTLVIGLPAILLTRNTPEDKGLTPDGDVVAEEAEQTAAVTLKEKDYTVKEALKTVSFWQVAIAQTFNVFVIAGVALHLIPYLIDRGYSSTIAASVLATVTGASIPTRIFVGWLGDRFPKRYLMAMCCLIELGALVILISTKSLGMAYLFAVVYAIGYGMIPLNTSIVGEYWGRKNFAFIRGMMGSITIAGLIGGPILAGWIYDLSHSYQIAFFSFMGCFFMAALIFFFAKPPKEQFGAIGFRAS